MYDRFGLQGVKDGGGGPPMHDIFDLFRGGGERRQRSQARPKCSPIKETLWITLADVYNGPTVELDIKYDTAEGGGMCTRCNGQGSVMETVRRGNMIMQH